MSWAETYRTFLVRSQFHDPAEISEFVREARDVVGGIPEPYRARVVAYLEAQNRDDFVAVDFEILRATFGRG